MVGRSIRRPGPGGMASVRSRRPALAQPTVDRPRARPDRPQGRLRGPRGTLRGNPASRSALDHGLAGLAGRILLADPGIGGRHTVPQGRARLPAEDALDERVVAVAPVSYTHLRAHETVL